MQQLNDGNSEYFSANQFIVYDYTMYDGWYTTNSEDKAAYYESSYSEELQNAIATNPEEPFSDAYYEGMYATANEKWAESDADCDGMSCHAGVQSNPCPETQNRPVLCTGLFRL